MNEIVKAEQWKISRPYGLWYFWKSAFWVRFDNRYRGTTEPVWHIGRLLEMPVAPIYQLEQGSDRFVFPRHHTVGAYYSFSRPSDVVRIAKKLGLSDHPIVQSARHLITQTERACPCRMVQAYKSFISIQKEEVTDVQKTC